MLILMLLVPNASTAGVPGVRNLGLATTTHNSIGMFPGPAVLLIDEAEQGRTDLDGNGNTRDQRVLFLYDTIRRRLTNMRLSVAWVQPYRPDRYFVELYEGWSGRDINGDGDTTDGLLVLLTPRTGAMQVVVTGAFYIGFYGDTAMLFMQEIGQDLNGDGDTTEDLVLHFLDLETLELRNMGLAVRANSYIQHGTAYVLGEESGQERDLNGDGDQEDYIAHLVDVATGSVHNTGVSGYFWTHNGTQHAIMADEYGMEADLNGDGDQIDDVVVLYDPATRTIENLGLAGNAEMDDDLLRIATFESSQGADMNGDGDMLDISLSLYELATGKLSRVPTTIYHGNPGLRVSSGRILLHTGEREEGNTDLNGDGDATDRVPRVYDPSDGSLRTFDLAGTWDFQLSRESRGIFSVFEDDARRDMNGDGDTADFVPAIYDDLTGEFRSLGVACSIWEIQGDRAAVIISESNQFDRDLNGNGAAFDYIAGTLNLETGRAEHFGNGALTIGFHGPDALGVDYETRSTDLNGDGDDRDEVWFAVHRTMAAGRPL